MAQGSGLGGLALGYYHAAPGGAPESRPVGFIVSGKAGAIEPRLTSLGLREGPSYDCSSAHQL
jgi:hypothetical protein